LPHDNATATLIGSVTATSSTCRKEEEKGAETEA